MGAAVLGMALFAGSSFGDEVGATSKPVAGVVASAPTSKPANEGYVPLPNKVVVTKVKHFDVVCWKIATGGGTFFFENGNDTGGTTGFNSAYDTDGNDWIGADDEKGFNTVPGCSTWGHKTRGFPKYTTGKEFETPTKKNDAKTRWLDKDGKDIEVGDKGLEGDHLIMRSFNADHEVEYHFFPTHAAVKMIKMNEKYAFHFQGLIGGEPNASPRDQYVLKDGKKRDLLLNGAGLPKADFPDGKFKSPFVYMVDNDDSKTQVFFMAAKNITTDNYGDEAWLTGCQDKSLNMAAVSFGRKFGGIHSLTGTETIFLFGFQPKAAGHEKISAFIEARLAAPFDVAK
jgi:hypothetical protein